MRKFNVYTGDGNDGTSYDHDIEAEDLDGAVAEYMKGVAPENRDLFDTTDGDEHVAYLTVYETEDGETAYNGGAYFCAEIWDAEHDPRCQPR